MKYVINEDVEKDWSQNGSLRHTFEDWLEITFEISKFDALFSIG